MKYKGIFISIIQIHLFIFSIFAAFSPAIYSPELWLDSSDSTTVNKASIEQVVSWNDRSGNGNDVTALDSVNRPVYSAFEKGIRFNGTDDFLLGNDSLLYGSDTTITIFIVATPDSGSEKGSVIAKGQWTSGSDYRIELGEHGYDICLQGARVWNSSSADWSIPHVNMIRCFYSDSKTVEYFYNGTRTELPKMDVEYNPNSEPFSIGARFNGANLFQGVIHEVLLFQKELTEDQMIQMEGYLAHKWNILEYLPDSHPFKESPYAIGESQVFTVIENSPVQTSVGIIKGIFTGDSVSFSNWRIENEGFYEGTFSLSNNGSITVKSGSLLDYEMTTAIALEVSAIADTTRVYGYVTIEIADIDDGDPVKQYSELWGQSGEKWDPRGRLPDFSFAGVHSGEYGYTYGSDSVNVLDYGADPTDSLSDYAAILAAIDAVDSGIVYFPAGLYVIDSIVEIKKSNVVLRGDGNDSVSGTRFYMPNSAADLAVGGNISTGDAGAIIEFKGVNAGASTEIIEETRMGDRSITVTSSSKFQVGDIVDIVFSGDHPVDGELWNHILNNQNNKWPCEVAWSNGNSGLSMYHTIERVEGDIITLREPIRLDLHTDWSPVLKNRTDYYLFNCGVEDLFIEHRYIPQPVHLSEPGFNSVELERTFHSWIKNVGVKNSDNGLTIKASGFSELKNCSFYGRGGHHGTSFNYSSHCLMDSLFYFNDSTWIHSLTLTHKSNGNVVSNIFGNGKDISTDFHRNTPWETLITNVDQPWNYNSSGVWCAGPNAGKRTVYWNMGGDGFTSYPSWDDYQTTLVGDMHIPEQFHPERGWHENVPGVSPSNLYEAQLLKRLNSSGSVSFAEGDLGDRNKWWERDPSRWDVIDGLGDLAYKLCFSDLPMLSGGRPGEYAVFDSVFSSDFTFSSRLWSPEDRVINSDADVVLIFDYQDDENYMYFLISNINSQSGLYSVDTGVSVLKEAIDAVLPENETVYTIEKKGFEVSLKMNGAICFTSTASLFDSGKIGIGSMNDAVIVRDLSFTEIPVTAISNEEENVSSSHFGVYPNPVSISDIYLNIIIPSKIRGEGIVMIFDVLGNLIEHQEIFFTGSNRLKWDLKNNHDQFVASGTYLLSMSVKNRNGSVKVYRTLIGVNSK